MKYTVSLLHDDILLLAKKISSFEETVLFLNQELDFFLNNKIDFSKNIKIIDNTIFSLEIKYVKLEHE